MQNIAVIIFNGHAVIKGQIAANSQRSQESYEKQAQHGGGAAGKLGDNIAQLGAGGIPLVPEPRHQEQRQK
ncbi:hypothetical protein D3C76_1725380 [compost metagenome]